MVKLRTLWSRVKGRADQGREDEGFDEEIREHIALLEERYTAQRMTARDAARVTRRQFGQLDHAERAAEGAARDPLAGGVAAGCAVRDAHAGQAADIE